MSGSVSIGRQQVSLVELREHGARAATGFSQLGVSAGDCVATLLRNDFSCFEVAFAADLLGVYVAPINWHNKSSEVVHVIQDSGARILVAHDDLLAAVQSDIPDNVNVFVVPSGTNVGASVGDDNVLTLWQDWLNSFNEWQGEAPPPVGSMIYTSGTTGLPKGIRRQPPHPKNLPVIKKIKDQMFGFSTGQEIRTVVTGPLYHSAPYRWALDSAAANAFIAIQQRFDAEDLLSLIETHSITLLQMVPTMFWRLLKLPEEIRGKYDLCSLEYVVHAAAPCPPGVKQSMLDWWGPIIHEYYGASEIGPISLANPDDAVRKPGTVGRLLEGAKIMVLDDDGNEVGTSQIGEFYLRQTLWPDFDYHNKPEERAALEKDGLVTVGDVGYVDEDGYLFLMDRAKDMVISGGVNIYPAETEAVLVTMPEIADCAVIGIPDREFGERLLAFVVRSGDSDIDSQGIIKWLSSKISGYKVPREYVFQDSLPREDSGKVFKKELRSQYWVDSDAKI